MNDMQLESWIRNLQRVETSRAFKTEVLRKARAADTPAPRTASVWQTVARATIAAGILAISLGSLQYVRSRSAASLRLEQQGLQAELQVVKQIATEPEPVVVFEDDHGTRVIMDLDSAAQPAAYHTFD